jgi:hypothetical protein
MGLCWIPAATAQESDARAVIEKAIMAQGGLEKLTKAKAGYRKIKGVFHLENDKQGDFKFTGESYSDAANRLKIIMRGTDDNPELHVMVVEDDKGWRSYNDRIIDFDDKEKVRLRRGSHADKVAGLVTLLRDKGYTLTLLGPSKVKDTAVVSVKVQYAAMPDISLFFDKNSGFLIKTAYRHMDVHTNQEFLQEVYYSRFEPFDPAAEAVKTLTAAKRSSDGPDLIKSLRQRVPDKEDRERMEVLIAELGRTSYSARQKASAALQKYGARAAGQLRLALKSQDREVVRRAEQLLDQIAQNQEAVLATAVVRLLAVRKPAGAVEALLTYLPWACDDAVAKEVQYALAAIVEQDAKARAVVEASLKRADLQERAALEAVLGRDGGVFLKQPWRRVIVEGVHIARVAQVYRDGKPYLDLETFDHQFYNCFDDALFARP